MIKLLFFLSICLGAEGLTLVWDNQNAQVDSYYIYIATNNPINFSHFAMTTNTTITTNLPPANYFFFVTASNFWGESGASNTISTPLPTSKVQNTKITP